MAGFVHTVLGRVNIEDIGRTLTHEHLCLDYTNYFVPPPPEVKEYLEGEISLQNVGFVQRYPYSSKSNISFFTDDLKTAVINDLMKYKRFGGNTIVENTNHGLKRDLLFLKKASELTGVKIVAGSGFYLASSQPNSVLLKTTEELYDLIKADLVSGCPELPEIKCGIIGEVASDYPIHSFEAKVIRATGMIQEELKCPVTFHPGRNSRAPSDIMRLFTESGGNSSKAVMSHIDRTLLSSENVLNFASEYKCFLQYDLFGTEVLTYQFHKETQMPSDFERIKRIEMLTENGYLSRILISQDIHTKHRLADYGGHGYFHVLCNIIPKMLSLGFSQSALDEITINNPKTWLSWNLRYIGAVLVKCFLIRSARKFLKNSFGVTNEVRYIHFYDSKLKLRKTFVNRVFTLK